MSFLTTLALITPLLTAGPGAVAPTPGPLVHAAYADARFEGLLAEYRAAELALQQVGRWTVDARRELLHSIHLRMRPLVDGGHGPAIGWTLANYLHDPLTAREPADVRRELWSRVLPAFAGAEWIWSPDVDLLKTLAADRELLGSELCASYAAAILDAQSLERFDRRLRALRVRSDALAPLGRGDARHREAAAAMWRRELERAPEGPLAAASERALWRLEKLHIDRPLPTVCGVDVDGNELCLEDFRGKVVVLAFVSLEHDSEAVERLVTLQNKLQGAPFTVVGVSQDTQPNTFRKLADRHEVRFPCIFDGGTSGRAAHALHLDGDEAPAALVLDRDGRLRAVDPDAATLDTTVRSLLRELTAQSPRPRDP